MPALNDVKLSLKIVDLEFLANMRDVAPMFKVLTNAIEATEKQIGEGAIKRAYVDESPHPVGERQLLDFADDGSKYSAMHKRLHPTLRKYLNSRGYYDIFLINPEGDIVYTVFKETDFQTNLVSPYAPSNGDQASFAAMPVYMSAGFGSPETLVGVVAVQLSVERMQGVILAEAASSSVQTYLVGEDGIVKTEIDAK